MHFRETITPQPIEQRELPTPYCLAEELSLEELEQQIARAAIPREDEWYPERTMINQAWAYLEFGLSTEIDDETAKEAFFQAQATAINIRGGEHQYYHQQLDAQFLYAFLPAFHDRRAGKPMTRESRLETMNRLVRIFDDIDQHEFGNEKDELGALVKVCAHAAFLRRRNVAGLFNFGDDDTQKMEVYPASARERLNRDELQQFNHDYAVVVGGQKAPVAIRSWSPSPKRKRTGGYDERVLVMAFSKIANAAMKAYGLEAGEEVIFDVAGMIQDEAAGEQLEANEHAALDAITSSLVIASLEHVIALRR